jgi:hypothetical protein
MAAETGRGWVYRIMGLEHETIKRVPFHATRDTPSEVYSG